MSTVQDMKRCPQCGGQYITDYNCRTNEEWRSCNSCGYHEEWKLERDKDGCVVFENGQPKMTYSKHDGFGVMRLQFEGIAQLGSLIEPITDAIKKEFEKHIADPRVIKDKCYLTVWDAEKGELSALYGTLPESYDDYMKRIEKEE